MPSAKTQKYLGYIGTMGVLTACFGCGLATQNQMRAAQIFLLVAWLILVPLFGYLISTRRHMKRIVRTHSAHRQEELDALASVFHEGSGTRSQELEEPDYHAGTTNVEMTTKEGE